MKCPVCNAELPSTAKILRELWITLAPPPPPPQMNPEQVWPVMNAINAPSNYAGGTLPVVQKKYKVPRFIAVLMRCSREDDRSIDDGARRRLSSRSR